MSMVDSSLLQALGLLTPDEQDAILALAKYLKHQRGCGAEPSTVPAALLAELHTGESRIASRDMAYRQPARLSAAFCERIHADAFAGAIGQV